MSCQTHQFLETKVTELSKTQRSNHCIVLPDLLWWCAEEWRSHRPYYRKSSLCSCSFQNKVQWSFPLQLKQFYHQCHFFLLSELPTSETLLCLNTKSQWKDRTWVAGLLSTNPVAILVKGKMHTENNSDGLHMAMFICCQMQVQIGRHISTQSRSLARLRSSLLGRRQWDKQILGKPGSLKSGYHFFLTLNCPDRENELA